jgi:hypothetical protein
MPKPPENTKQRPASLPSDVAALLEHYGITTVTKPVYEWGGYRYTNAGDAIAAAKRGEAA